MPRSGALTRAGVLMLALSFLSAFFVLRAIQWLWRFGRVKREHRDWSLSYF